MPEHDITEREFTLSVDDRTVPGVVWAPADFSAPCPVVLIGHTRGLAWSHTVSTAFRFTPFELKLVPGSPTTYLVDGQPKEMTS